MLCAARARRARRPSPSYRRRCGAFGFGNAEAAGTCGPERDRGSSDRAVLRQRHPRGGGGGREVPDFAFDLEVGARRPGIRRRETDFDCHLAVADRGRVRIDDELIDRNDALAALAAHDDRGIAGKRRDGPIACGIVVAEAADDRSHLAHDRIRHNRANVGQQRVAAREDLAG